jgi:hypothetical protein
LLTGGTCHHPAVGNFLQLKQDEQFFDMIEQALIVDFVDFSDGDQVLRQVIGGITPRPAGTRLCGDGEFGLLGAATPHAIHFDVTAIGG